MAARPELEVSPTSVDFGSMQPGARSTRTVTITGRGVSAVLLSSVTVQGDDAFSATPVVSRELAGGESLQVEVAFAPRARGSHAARLVITSNAVNAPELLVPIVGDASGCAPTTCAAQQKNCGSMSDGCSGQLDCGVCAGVETCGGRGVPNVCGCTETDAALCTRLTKNCGTLTTVDKCGSRRSVDCGSCTAPAVCAGGGTANVCACTAETDTAFCTRAGKQCGPATATDLCGMARTVDCGSCAAPNSCGGGGTANVCGCTPESDTAICARLNATCGTVTAMSCGVQRTVSCGTCTMPATCGGGGAANVCACAAETDMAFCTRLGKTCGSVTAADSCGQMRTASCGTCMMPATCGGAGTVNVCGCPGETDVAFCARVGAQCGPVTAADTCGLMRTTMCGGCTLPATCGGAGMANRCGCAETDAAFCTRLQKNCGQVSGTDACGVARTAECGLCAGTSTCGATNVCSCTPETNQAFCTRLNVACGSRTAADNCNAQRTVDCGPCGACAAPGTIPPLGHVVNGTTSGTSTMSGTCGGGSAPEQVWAYTPQTSGSVTISSCGSSFDTVVSVLSNTCPGGAQVTCNDNSANWCSNGTTHSYVTFTATAGTTYYVVVDGAGSGSGGYNLRVAPPDGTCSVPVQIPANGGTVRLGVNGTSTNSGSCGGSGADKVHRWVAPRSGTATVTMSADFWPATLYVRSGNCATGTQLACDNRTNQFPTNTISFPVTAGTEYFIWAGLGTYNGPVVSIYELTVSLP